MPERVVMNKLGGQTRFLYPMEGVDTPAITKHKKPIRNSKNFNKGEANDEIQYGD